MSTLYSNVTATQQIFTFGLGLTPPWFVEDISMETAETSVLTVHVRANQGAKYPRFVESLARHMATLNFPGDI